MSWWRPRKTVEPTQDPCAFLCQPVQGQPSQPLSRKRYQNGDEPLQGQKLPSADIMLGRLMAGHLGVRFSFAGLAYVQIAPRPF